MARSRQIIGCFFRITGCDEGYNHLLGAKAYAFSLTRVRIVTGTHKGLEVPLENLKLRKLKAQVLCRCGAYKFPHRLSIHCEDTQGG